MVNKHTVVKMNFDGTKYLTDLDQLQQHHLQGLGFPMHKGQGFSAINILSSYQMLTIKNQATKEKFYLSILTPYSSRKWNLRTARERYHNHSPGRLSVKAKYIHSLLGNL